MAGAQWCVDASNFRKTRNLRRFEQTRSNYLSRTYSANVTTKRRSGITWRCAPVDKTTANASEVHSRRYVVSGESAVDSFNKGTSRDRRFFVHNNSLLSSSSLICVLFGTRLASSRRSVAENFARARTFILTHRGVYVFLIIRERTVLFHRTSAIRRAFKKFIPAFFCFLVMPRIVRAIEPKSDQCFTEDALFPSTRR